MAIREFMPERLCGLWDRLPPAQPVASDSMWFEAWEQNQGMAVYRTMLPTGSETTFTFEHLNDYGQVYLGGTRLATIDRRLGEKKTVAIPAREKPAALEVLVEGMGHINFNIAMETDRKGLFGEMTLGDTCLDQWSVSPLPQSAVDIELSNNMPHLSERPGSYFRAAFNIESSPADTFLDMSKYEKGVVWVNGHNLGRYWSVGPQLRLYCPAPWLKRGRNIIDIIDLELTLPRPIRGCLKRNYDMNNSVTRNANNQW
jgi:beta-galactosidase